MHREELLDQIRKTVREVEPGAEIILYGSRSRGDAVSESDWDFLVLVDGPLNDERIDRIRHRLYEVEWDSEEVISSIVRNKDEWSSNFYQALPFHQRVEQEGIKL
ncbi:MAG: nucleotidyltransferase domain-containing protein [Pseudomonadota bacterium]